MHLVFVTTQVITRHATLKRAVELGPALRELGWKVTVLLEDHPDNREALERAGLEGCYHRGGTSWREESRTKEEHLRRLNPDVVSLCNIAWRHFLDRRCSPESLWLTDLDEMIATIRLFPWWFRWLQRRLETICLRRYDGVVCASRYLEFHFRRKLFRMGLSRPVLWLPYAYKNSFRDRVTENGSRHTPGPPWRISYMGSFYTHYGCYTMLEALEHLSRQRTDWTARLFGHGREHEACLQWVRERKLESRIELPGYVPVDELETSLLEADVFLSPMFDTEQDWARCPSKIYPYIATGRPIVTAPVGENGEALGADAFYYRPGEARSMAHAIGRALDACPTWTEPAYVPRHDWMTRARRWDEWVRGNLEARAAKPPP